MKQKTVSELKQPDYGRYARFYDFFELAGHEETQELNVFLTELFTINGVKSVLDFACGTGAQSIGLAKAGFTVTACDLSPQMLEVAAIKAGKLKLDFRTGDMRTASYGLFDAAICIFNAIGHLRRDDCRAFFANACGQLNPGGLFVVDILNFTAMAGGVFKEYSYMSREAIIDSMLVHHVRDCKLSRPRRQISIKSVTRWQDGFNAPDELNENWQMQIYDGEEIREMLLGAGFEEVMLFGPTGSDFDPEKSDSVLAVAQKKQTKGKKK